MYCHVLRVFLVVLSFYDGFFIRPLEAIFVFLLCKPVFRRWAINPYSTIRTDDELKESLYTEGEVKGRKVMRIEFNLCKIVERGHRQSLDEYSLIRKLKQRYGNLLQSIQSIEVALLLQQ